MGLPLMATGERQAGIGVPLFGPRRRIPSASSRRKAPAVSFCASNGLITAIGVPRHDLYVAYCDESTTISWIPRKVVDETPEHPLLIITLFTDSRPLHSFYFTSPVDACAAGAPDWAVSGGSSFGSRNTRSFAFVSSVGNSSLYLAVCSSF